MTKNNRKVTKTVTLELVGVKTVIGLQDLINESPTYTMSMMCISQTAQLYRIHVDAFKLLKKSASGAKDTQIWNMIVSQVLEGQYIRDKKFNKNKVA